MNKCITPRSPANSTRIAQCGTIRPTACPAGFVEGLIGALESMPEGTVPAATLADTRRSLPRAPAVVPQVCDTAPTWREKIWTVPAETRLGVREVAEALGRSKDFVYRHTAPNGSGLRIPHRKLDGALVFVAHELRGWVEQSEVVISSPVACLRAQPRHRLRLERPHDPQGIVQPQPKET